MKKSLKYILIASTIVLITITYSFKNIRTFSPSIPSIKIEILGSWVLENDSSTKIIFSKNGQLKNYEDNVLKSTDKYKISKVCGKEKLSNGELFLKIIDGEIGAEYCDIINGVNANGSNILSLTSDSGKLSIYVRP